MIMNQFIGDCHNQKNLYKMALTGQLRFLTKLKKGHLKNFDEDKGCMSSLIHLAIMDNNYHKLKLLIDAGLSVNVRYRPDVKVGNIFVLTFKIIFRNHHDLTPLHLACSRGNPKMVQLLIK